MTNLAVKSSLARPGQVGPQTVSVIIPAYNAAGTIGEQLDALAGQDYAGEWEILVVDNGSTDGTPGVVGRYMERLPHLRLIEAVERSGPAYARNAGARAARGDLLLFCDSDDVVAPGWLAAMARGAARLGFVACRFDTEKLNPAWVAKSRANPQRDGLKQYTYPPFLPHAAAAGLGIKRSLHERVGGFDETLRNLQDTDYCWRLQLAGVELHFVPEALLYYRYRASLKSIYRQACSYAEHNVLLYKRYRPAGMPPLAWHSGLRFWLDLVTRLPRLRTKPGRARWLWQFGWRVGRLRGSFKHRVIAFQGFIGLLTLLSSNLGDFFTLPG